LPETKAKSGMDSSIKDLTRIDLDGAQHPTLVSFQCPWFLEKPQEVLLSRSGSNPGLNGYTTRRDSRLTDLRMLESNEFIENYRDEFIQIMEQQI
jgi:hypothetical protein